VGEAGTGKSAVALLIHRNRRRSEPFMVFDCAASDPEAWEATWRRCTAGGAAAGILLERLNDAQPQLQACMLRSLDAALQPGPHILATITSDQETSRNGLSAVRRDLLDRIAVRVVHVPPLRERGREFDHIVHELLADIDRSQGSAGTTVSDEAMVILRAYRWPGNVRQLRNLLARAMRATRSHQLGIEALPSEVFVSTIGRRLHLIERLESAAILGALNLTGGNVSSAAEHLGLSRATLYRRLRSYELLSRATGRGRTPPRRLRAS
jgi:DNA-binding NtrC family response regulator